MSSRLRFCLEGQLPWHPEGDFDHGDVFLATGTVFLANTAAGTVEVVDGEQGRHLGTIPDCPEASGVLCAQDWALLFAAARGAGKLLVIDPTTHAVLRTVTVGPRPNGLAWDPVHHHLLVADVQENIAQLVDPHVGQVLTTVPLPGRPRWAVYHQRDDRFLVNIREPAEVTVLDAATGTVVGHHPVSVKGPHGLDLDQHGDRAFIACDGGAVVTLDAASGSELSRVSIAGAPDAIWHNHQRNRLYVAISDPGVIEVINTTTMTVEEQIPTQRGAHTTAFDAKLQRLYVFLPRCRIVVYEESEVE